VKKYFTALNIVFATEIATVVLASWGSIPREVTLIMAGLMIVYVVFSSVENSLMLTLMSIPLFVALPITTSFDTMADWRLIIAVLFISLFFRLGVSVSLIKDESGKWHFRENVRHYLAEYLTWAFLSVGALSILVAEYKVLGVKKLLFIINIFLLHLVIRNFLGKTGQVDKAVKVLRALGVGSIITIAVGLIQLLVTLFVPLAAFWQYWAGKIILVFYGKNLSELLKISNTWFAYYANKPPTLRIFSVFPDSHSSAMFLILSLPVFLSLAVFFQAEKRQRQFYWIMAALATFLVIMSGSRGAWLSFIPVGAVGLYLFIKKIELYFTKKIIIAFVAFGALFLVSSLYPFLYYKVQSMRVDLALFERAKSISDLDEISNKGRLEIWLTSAKSIIAHPILGVGLGNYISVLGEDVSAVKKGASAHNLYLDFAAEIGIAGALFLITMFLEILRSSWRFFKEAKEPYLKAFCLFFGLYFLWAMIYSLFDVVLLNDKVLMFFVAEIAVLYSVHYLAQKELKIINPHTFQKSI